MRTTSEAVFIAGMAMVGGAVIGLAGGMPLHVFIAVDLIGLVLMVGVAGYWMWLDR